MTSKTNIKTYNNSISIQNHLIKYKNEYNDSNKMSDFFELSDKNGNKNIKVLLPKMKSSMINLLAKELYNYLQKHKEKNMSNIRIENNFSITIENIKSIIESILKSNDKELLQIFYDIKYKKNLNNSKIKNFSEIISDNTLLQKLINKIEYTYGTTNKISQNDVLLYSSLEYYLTILNIMNNKNWSWEGPNTILCWENPNSNKKSIFLFLENSNKNKRVIPNSNIEFKISLTQKQISRLKLLNFGVKEIDILKKIYIDTIKKKINDKIDLEKKKENIEKKNKNTKFINVNYIEKMSYDVSYTEPTKLPKTDGPFLFMGFVPEFKGSTFLGMTNMTQLNAKNVLRVFMKKDGQFVLDYYRKDKFDKYLYVTIESNPNKVATKKQYELYKRNLINSNHNSKEVTLGFTFKFDEYAGYSWGNKKNKYSKVNFNSVLNFEISEQQYKHLNELNINPDDLPIQKESNKDREPKFYGLNNISKRIKGKPYIFMGKIDKSELNKSFLGKTNNTANTANKAYTEANTTNITKTTNSTNSNGSHDVYMKADGYFIVDKLGMNFNVTILDEHQKKMYDKTNKYFKFKLKNAWNIGWN